MRNKVLYIYAFIFIVSIALLCSILFYDRTTSMRQFSPTENSHIWSEYTIDQKNDTVILNGAICDTTLEHDILAFFSAHLNFKVYVDNSLIYEYPVVNNNPFSSSSGYSWHFIKLPPTATVLQMEITSAYDDIAHNIPIFYMGNTASIISTVIHGSLVSFILCVMLLCSGIIMIAYWIIIRSRVMTSPSIMYLGIYAILIALWSLAQNPFMILVLNNNLVTSYAAFNLLMLIPFPVIRFIKSYYEDRNHIVWDIMCTLTLLQNIICILLQYLKIVDFRETLWVTLANIVICTILILFYSFHLYRRGHKSKKIIFHIICLAIFLTLLFVDMFIFYITDWQDSLLARVGIMAYVLILGYDSIKESAALMKMGEQANAYHQLAFSDNMTGLGNRTAFNHDFSHYAIAPEGVAIIDFDLNGLKQVNDTHGHQAGDRYIILASEMIERNFSKLGKTYRIGGDEFVVIVADCENISFEPYFDALQTDMVKYNKRNTPFPIHIAYGMAIYSATMDRSLEDTYGRADKAMYQNKKLLKEQGTQ